MNIGEKIRAIRKEKKMTLVQVAGDQLTKGMLSLIENGKAQPSMESLLHIANQLQIDVSELLQNKHFNELTALYKEAEQIAADLNTKYGISEIDGANQKLVDIISPYMKENALTSNRFEEIRLRELYYMARNALTGETPIEELKEIEKMYENIHAYSGMVKCGIYVCELLFKQQNYNEALQYGNVLERYIEQYGGLIDEVQRLNLYYSIALMSAAISDVDRMEFATNQVLTISKQSRVFYHIDDLYRFLFFIHCDNKDKEKCNYYLDKVKAFANILEDPSNDLIVQLLQFVYWNQIEHNYEKVINQPIETYQLPEDFMRHGYVFLYGEKAYAHIMRGEFSEAKSYLTDIFVSKFNSHPIDLGFIYRTFAMRALCLFEEGDIENAKRDILYAMNGVKGLVINEEIRMIQSIYDRVMSNK